MQQFQRTSFGEYILHDRIGAGGMAEIFLATAQGIEGFEKRLVIKRILPTFTGDDQFVRMFIEEAKLCVALRHPNIVQVYDLGEIDGQYFIAMEYVDGRDLLKTLAACGKKRIGFPTDIALYIVMEVLKGLDYAHNLKRPDGRPLGIIHRDVSPSNVLLSFEGEVKIADFGIAKASTREKTETGILKGKFGYMAPEQVTGAPIDHRADIFAIGILLYELLTGHRLFAGKNDLQVLERVRDAQIEPPPRHYRPDLADELERIVMTALSREPRVRFQMAAELHDALYEYTFKSRATIGPPQLAHFLQDLFLSDPEEIERRQRVFLPVIARGRGPSRANGAQNGAASPSDSNPRASISDIDLSRFDRSGLEPFAVAEPPGADRTHEDAPNSDVFEEETPLLHHPGLHTDDGAIPADECATPLAGHPSQVVYIAPDECWELPEPELSGPTQHPELEDDETPLINVSSQEALRIPLRINEPRGISIARFASLTPEKPIELPARAQIIIAPSVPAPAERKERKERTERTEFSTLSRQPGESGREIVAERAPRATKAIEEIRALRQAREENLETDLDVEGGGPKNLPIPTSSEVQVANPAPRSLSATVDENREPLPEAGDRGTSGLDTVVHEKAEADAERAWAPSEIVERTQSSESDEDEEPTAAHNDEIEPTVRFDSSISLPAIRDDEDLEEASPNDLIEVEPTGTRTFPDDPSPMFFEPGGSLQRPEARKLQPEDGYHAEEHSDFGTLVVLDSDLPTSEVSERELISYERRRRTEEAEAEAKKAAVEADEEPTRDVGSSGITRPPEVLSSTGHDVLSEDADLGGATRPDQDPLVTADATVRDDQIACELETEDGSRPVAMIAEDPSGPTEESVELPRTDRDAPPVLSDRTTPSVEALPENVPEPRLPSRRRPITGQRSRPVLLPANDDEPALSVARRVPSRRALSGAKLPTPQRRRVTALSGFSVVNPKAPSDQQITQKGDPGIFPQPRAPSVAKPLRAPSLGIAGPRLQSTLEVGVEVTGAGILVDEATDSGELASPLARVPLAADPGVELPARRDSSGVTAAVSESRLIDEQIREIRSQSQIGRARPEEPTTFGVLAGDRRAETGDVEGRDASPSAITSPAEEVDEEVDEEGKTDLHREVMKRQKRRRFATDNVVLFGEDDHSRNPAFVDPGEDSNGDPVLTSAGRLDDSGASDLFGVLSMLESDSLIIKHKSFEPQEEISLDTDAGHLAENGADRPMIAPSVVMELEQKRSARPDISEVERERDMSRTGLGSLAPDDFAEPRPGAARAFNDPAGNSLPPSPPIEDTASVTDGQVMEVSSVIRSDLPPEAVSDPALAARPGSGIEIAFDSLRSGLDEGPIEEIDDEGSTAIEDAPEEEGEGREPAKKAKPKAGRPNGAPLAASAASARADSDLDSGEAASFEAFAPTPSELDAPPLAGSEPQKKAEPGKKGGHEVRPELRLVSASFDINSSAPAAPRQPGGGGARRGADRSNGRPAFEPTPSATPPPSPKRGKEGSPVRGPIDRRPAREVVRTNGQLVPAPAPTPKGAARPAVVAGAAAGARGAAAAPLVVLPSVSQGYSGSARAVGMNKLLTVIVLLATVLAVAAAVTLLLERNRSPVAIAPLSSSTSRTVASAPMPSPDPIRRPSPPAPKETPKKTEIEKPAPPAPPIRKDRLEAEEEKRPSFAAKTARAEEPAPTPAPKHTKPKKAAAKKPKASRTAAAPLAQRETEAAAPSTSELSMGTVELSCPEPSAINIGRKKFPEITRKKLKIEPGSYAVVITRPGLRKTLFVTVIAGQTVPIPCGE